MVEVKLRKHKNGDGKGYFSYMVTLPKPIIDSYPKFANVSKVRITITKKGILLTPI